LFELTYVFPAAAMAGMAPEGSQFDAKNYDSKMQELL
jgi:translation initiation factor 4A